MSSDPSQSTSRHPAEVWQKAPLPHCQVSYFDPIQSVLTDLLRGQGELSKGDMDRLHVFRPEAVQTAVGSLTLPKKLQKDERAQARLAELQRYAADLVTAAPPTITQMNTPLPSAMVEAPKETEAAAAETTAIRTPEATPAPTTTGKTPDDSPDPPMSPEPFPPHTAPADQKTEVRYPIAAATRTFAVSVSQTEIRPPQPIPLGCGLVRTADDLLSLTPDERREMVVFLQPTELADVLKRTDDTQLKRAIVDTLGRVATPASLELLNRCLNDPDPQIRLYALQAADRVLGHGVDDDEADRRRTTRPL
ncbi:MAG: HEAT repeat domain-containing protein [Thermoleophilia bacterium]|jgi:hypothetical protein